MLAHLAAIFGVGVFVEEGLKCSHALSESYGCSVVQGKCVVIECLLLHRSVEVHFAGTFKSHSCLRFVSRVDICYTSMQPGVLSKFVGISAGTLAESGGSIGIGTDLQQTHAVFVEGGTLWGICRLNVLTK